MWFAAERFRLSQRSTFEFSFNRAILPVPTSLTPVWIWIPVTRLCFPGGRVQSGVDRSEPVREVGGCLRLPEVARRGQGCDQEPEPHHRHQLLSYSRGPFYVHRFCIWMNYSAKLCPVNFLHVRQAN